MTSTVYARLHEGIITGEYAAGEQLVETVLATQFGISRTPIREALRRLEQDGLVERGSRGMQVCRRSPEEILEIYEVRIILEAAAARAAAERGTTLDLMRLEQLHAAMVAAEPNDGDTLATTNRKFHEIIWSMSHNKTLVDLLTRLHAHLIRYRETTLTYPDRWQTVLKEHEELIEAIKNKDGDRAADIATSHMAGARNTRLLMYADDSAHV
jgi:DNA-binding GntR family transcriptional regulator